MTLLLLGGCFSPEMGTWTVTSETVTANSCDSVEGDEVSSNGSFGMSELDDGFLVDTDDSGMDDLFGTETFSCVLEGKDFDCEVLTGEAVYAGATISYSHTASGAFEDPETLTADRVFGLDCDGASCGAVDDFPCEVTIHLAASFGE